MERVKRATYPPPRAFGNSHSSSSLVPLVLLGYSSRSRASSAGSRAEGCARENRGAETISYPSCSPVSLCHTALFTESEGRGKRHTQDLRGVLGMIAEPNRNRRATTTLSPILYLFQFPSSPLSRKLQIVLSQEDQIPLVIETQRRPGPKDIPYGIPVEEWPTVLARVENHASYRTIARDYGVSRETIRRLVQALKKAG